MFKELLYENRSDEVYGYASFYFECSDTVYLYVALIQWKKTGGKEKQFSSCEKNMSERHSAKRQKAIHLLSANYQGFSGMDVYPQVHCILGILSAGGVITGVQSRKRKEGI